MRAIIPAYRAGRPQTTRPGSGPGGDGDDGDSDDGDTDYSPGHSCPSDLRSDPAQDFIGHRQYASPAAHYREITGWRNIVTGCGSRGLGRGGRGIGRRPPPRAPAEAP